jgi:hypothetical protein
VTAVKTYLSRSGQMTALRVLAALVGLAVLYLIWEVCFR